MHLGGNRDAEECGQCKFDAERLDAAAEEALGIVRTGQQHHVTGKRLQAANKKRRQSIAKAAAAVPPNVGPSAQSRTQAFVETKAEESAL